tara:strand:+ start:3612 stop:3953 length:342 start_codon:yes stop_codon:yes gene_type:complete
MNKANVKTMNEAWEEVASINPQAAASDVCREMFMKGWAAALSDCPISNIVMSKIKQRSDQGIQKFGGNMDEAYAPLIDWVMEAQEEALDLTVYLEKIISVMKRREKHGDLREG